MRFVHFTDTHLGKSEGRIQERELDFYKTFRDVISFCIEQKVDFVVHSGDLFDKARPPISTLIFVSNQLRKLKENNIPFFIVPGSHDIGVTDTVISFFDALGLLTNLASEKYLKHIDGKIYLSGENVGDCFICGVSGKRSRIEEMYKNLQIRGDGKYKIFIFHHIVSDIAKKFADIPTEALPKGFDYYAAGHWHGYFRTKYDKGIVVYPSSTEYTDLTEIQSEKQKYFCLIDTQTKEVKDIPLKTREIIMKEINCSGIDSREVNKKCLEQIEKNDNHAILLIKLLGKLSSGIKSEIDRNQLLNYASEKGYLFTKIYLADLENPETRLISTEKKTLSQIEEEYLVQQRYDSRWVDIAKQLIVLLGKKIMPSELEKIKHEAIQIIGAEKIEDK